MKKRVLAALLSALFLGACMNTQSIIVEGMVSYKGASPHSFLAVMDQKTHQIYKIANPTDFALEKRQNQSVKLKAQVVKKAIGRGFPAVIKVLRIESK